MKRNILFQKLFLQKYNFRKCIYVPMLCFCCIFSGEWNKCKPCVLIGFHAPGLRVCILVIDYKNVSFYLKCKVYQIGLLLLLWNFLVIYTMKRTGSYTNKRIVHLGFALFYFSYCFLIRPITCCAIFINISFLLD